MRRDANRRARVVESYELRLEEDVAVDLQVRTAVGLDGAEAVYKHRISHLSHDKEIHGWRE
jgi:hypothetical protein